MSFNKAILRTYAQHQSPNSLPPNVYFHHTDNTVTIFDAYPKAIFHFLVLPRISKEPYSASNLISLRKFLASPQVGKERARELIQTLKDDAEEIVEKIGDEMMDRFGFKWQVYTAFHAVQSMDHIHLHVISEDLCSPSLKTKKHYNSFRPKLGFFLHIDDVLSWFDSDRTESSYKSLIRLDEASYEKKLKEPLECFRCGQELKNMPLLKTHLQEHFDRVAKVFANRATKPKDTEPQTSSRKRKDESTGGREDADKSRRTGEPSDAVTSEEFRPIKKQKSSSSAASDQVENS